jgi:hypothetical protein
MSDKPIPLNDGYQPKIEKGYQPVPPNSTPTGTGGTGNVRGGYQPPSTEGGGPTNPPPNKK